MFQLIGHNRVINNNNKLLLWTSPGRINPMLLVVLLLWTSAGRIYLLLWTPLPRKFIFTEIDILLVLSVGSAKLHCCWFGEFPGFLMDINITLPRKIIFTHIDILRVVSVFSMFFLRWILPSVASLISPHRRANDFWIHNSQLNQHTVYDAYMGRIWGVYECQRTVYGAYTGPPQCGLSFSQWRFTCFSPLLTCLRR